MAWDDELSPAGQAEGPKGPKVEGASPRPARPPRRRLGLGHLMVFVAGCSLVLMLGRQFARSGSGADAAFLLIGAGVLLAAMGGWVLARLDDAAAWGWGLLVVGYIMVTAATFHFFSLISWPIVIGVLVSVIRRKRATEQDALVGVMAIAAGRRMPLAPGISAFAEQSSGASRRWARSLATLLDQGWPLAEAVEALPGTVSRPAAVLIRVGSSVDALGPALRAAVDLRASRPAALREAGGRLGYLAWLLVLGQAIVGFLAYFIMPKFEAILKDFGMDMPGPSQAMTHASHAVIDYGPLIVLSELLVAGYLALEVSGRGPAIFSPIARFSLRRHAALILRALALAVDAGRPLAPTLAILAETYPSWPIRGRLLAASRDLADGKPWTDALRDRGLLTRAEAGVLDAAGRAGNLAWALREMAITGERRWAYRIQSWSQVAFFIALLGAGGVVLLVALAYFLPLVHLISRLGG